jgi:hypothetical protein
MAWCRAERRVGNPLVGNQQQSSVAIAPSRPLDTATAEATLAVPEHQDLICAAPAARQRRRLTGQESRRVARALLDALGARADRQGAAGGHRNFCSPTIQPSRRLMMRLP